MATAPSANAAVHRLDHTALNVALRHVVGQSLPHSHLNMIVQDRSGARRHRGRALLYAGKPNWDLLATVTPR